MRHLVSKCRTGWTSHWPTEHAHFGDRVMLRREFMVTTAGALGTVLGASLWIPELAFSVQMDGSAPKPIPGGFRPPFTERFIHHYVPPQVQSGRDPSQITDFNGIVGVAQIAGTGTGTDKKTGATSQLLYEIDNRFMKGTYVGVDGQQYTRTFGFL